MGVLLQVRSIWLDYWSKCDATFGRELRAEVQKQGLKV